MYILCLSYAYTPLYLNKVTLISRINITHRIRVHARNINVVCRIDETGGKGDVTKEKS